MHGLPIKVTEHCYMCHFVSIHGRKLARHNTNANTCSGVGIVAAVVAMAVFRPPPKKSLIRQHNVLTTCLGPSYVHLCENHYTVP